MVEEEFLNSIIERVKPLLIPALEKLEDYMGEDEKMIIIRKPKDAKGYVVILDTKDITSFKLARSDYKRHKMRDFLEKLISGKISEEFNSPEEDTKKDL